MIDVPDRQRQQRERGPVSLDIGNHIQLLLVEHVHDGHITESFNHYFDDGQWIWHTATLALRTLTKVGRLQLGEPMPDRSRPVALTEVGWPSTRRCASTNGPSPQAEMA